MTQMLDYYDMAARHLPSGRCGLKCDELSIPAGEDSVTSLRGGVD
ncbi:hypothetical protein PG2022B_1700 [Bifidobacterium animalis subsp. animalis]|nr:hypothetical protein PG2022B_1700 [Bifidobacterium animalis subsp. animalis]